MRMKPHVVKVQREGFSHNMGILGICRISLSSENAFSKIHTSTTATHLT